MQNQIIPAEFHGATFKIIEHAGRRWLTAEQVGLALGYGEANARQGIGHLFRRHADEFTDADTCEVKLTSNLQGGNPNARVFSSTGCIKLGFFANTGRAKDFRAWAAKVLDGQPPAAPVVYPHVNSGRQGITRHIERRVFELFVSGLMQKQIAKELGISPASVNLLLRAKYQFAYWAGAPECSPELIAAVAQRHLVVEQDKLLAAQERIAQTFCSHANNRQLEEELNAVGQRLALPALGGAA